MSDAAAAAAAVAASPPEEDAVEEVESLARGDDTEQADPALTAESNPSHFSEREEVIAALIRLRDALPKAHDAEVARDSPAIAAAVFVETTLGKYQEFPELIKHHLEALIAPLTDAVLQCLPDAESRADSIGSQSIALATVDARLGQNFDDYDDDATRTALHTACHLLYVIAKVAGPKSTTGYYPHDVRLVERVFYCLRLWQATRHREWEVRYALLLWLSNLVLVPFSLSTIDSTSDESLGEQLLACAVGFLEDPSRCSDAAAHLIARLMTRPDSAARRDSFVNACVVKLECNDVGRGGGLLRALATTFKIGKRDELYDHALRLIPVAAKHALKSPDAIVTKTAVKLMQRLAITLLPNTQSSWRYKKRQSNLEANLKASGAPPQAAAADGSATTVAGEEGTEIEIPEELAVALEVLLQGLSHKDTIVRYSSAKGIGRICERLPEDCAADVMDAVLQRFEVFENDSGWHGACLSLAESCRRSVLLPQYFERVIPLVSKALTYDVSKGSYSVGSHVRDAACYVCWSVARAYEISDLLGYVEQISSTLVTVALFDREVNVRRAAAAAFQECVGRLGDFPHGIALVQIMDFFSLSSLGNAYQVVAPQVAGFDTYRAPLVDHLLTVKLEHWDRDVRNQAAQALGRLAAMTDASRVTSGVLPALLARAVSATVIKRHGGIVGVAELVRRMPPETWNEKQISDMVSVPPQLEAKRLFRGRGGEYLRQACCSLLRFTADAALILPKQVTTKSITGEKKHDAVGKHTEFLEETWKQPLEWLQNDAVAAFQAYAARYITEVGPTQTALLTRLITSAGDSTKTPNERRGCSLVLGVLPPSLMAPESLDHIFSSLETAAAFDPAQAAEEQDAETRRNAVIAAASIGETLSRAAVRSVIEPDLLKATLSRIAGILKRAFEDYAIDKRGDVGSFVRTAAISRAMELLTTLSRNDALTLLPEGDAEALVCAVVKQFCEKIDKVRAVCGQLLRDLAAVEPVCAVSPVIRAATSIACKATVHDWGQPTETFPLVVAQLLRVPELMPHVVRGLLPAAGGKVMHVVKPSLDMLTDALRGDADLREAMSMEFVAAAQQSFSDARLTENIFALMDRLVERDVLHDAALPGFARLISDALKLFTKDIKIVLPLVAPLATLCRAEDDAVRHAAQQRMLLTIASRYPAVRRLCGVEFFTALTVLGKDEAATLVAGTQWDSTDVALVRGARDSLYPLLGLEKPATATNTMAADTGASAKGKGFSSYKQLVKEMGY